MLDRVLNAFAWIVVSICALVVVFVVSFLGSAMVVGMWRAGLQEWVVFVGLITLFVVLDRSFSWAWKRLHA
jgi:hypothetical protein